MQYAVVRFQTCNTILRSLAAGATPQDVRAHVQRLHEVTDTVDDAARSRYANFKSVRTSLASAAKELHHLLSLADEAVEHNDARELQLWIEEIKRVPFSPELPAAKAEREARIASYKQAKRHSNDQE